MSDKLQAALLRVVSSIIMAGVPQGYDLRERADTLTNTHPTDEAKAEFMLWAFFYCTQQADNYNRSKIERDAYKNIAADCRREIKGLMI